MSKDGITQLILEGKFKNKNEDNSFRPDTRLQGNSVGGNSNQVLENLVATEKQRGFDQGYQEAIQRAQAEWDTKLGHLNNLIEALEQPLKDLDEEIQNSTLQIAIAIAKQIIRRELTVDSGQIVSAVKQAIDLIPRDGQQVNIYINPKDEEHVNQLFSQNGNANKFTIVQDPTISLGGCRASTDYSLVDLSIEKQVAMIAAQVFGEQRKSNN